MRIRNTTSRPAASVAGPKRLTLSLIATVGLLAPVLAGCSGGSGPAVASVASIPNTATAGSSGAGSTTAAAGSSQASIDARRPQLRVDTTEAEHARLSNIWVDCLHDRGVPIYQKGAGKITWRFPQSKPEDNPKAWAACADKQPRIPASEDSSRNPHYAEDWHNYVKCLNRNSKVIKVVEGGPGDWTYANDDGSQADLEAFDVVDHNCELQVFGRG